MDDNEKTYFVLLPQKVEANNMTVKNLRQLRSVRYTEHSGAATNEILEVQIKQVARNLCIDQMFATISADSGCSFLNLYPITFAEIHTES